MPRPFAADGSRPPPQKGSGRIPPCSRHRRHGASATRRLAFHRGSGKSRYGAGDEALPRLLFDILCWSHCLVVSMIATDECAARHTVAVFTAVAACYMSQLFLFSSRLHAFLSARAAASRREGRALHHQCHNRYVLQGRGQCSGSILHNEPPPHVFTPSTLALVMRERVVQSWG